MSDGTASFDSRQAPMSSAGTAGEDTGPPARILQFPGARRRAARRRRLMAMGEWAALAGMGVAAALLVLMTVIGLMAH